MGTRPSKYYYFGNSWIRASPGFERQKLNIKDLKEMFLKSIAKVLRNIRKYLTLRGENKLGNKN